MALTVQDKKWQRESDARILTNKSRLNVSELKAKDREIESLKSSAAELHLKRLDEAIKAKDEKIKELNIENELISKDRHDWLTEKDDLIKAKDKEIKEKDKKLSDLLIIIKGQDWLIDGMTKERTCLKEGDYVQRTFIDSKNTELRRLHEKLDALIIDTAKKDKEIKRQAFALTGLNKCLTENDKEIKGLKENLKRKVGWHSGNDNGGQPGY